MFSIWTKGMLDCLNLRPGGPTAKLTSLRGKIIVSIGGPTGNTTHRIVLCLPAKGHAVLEPFKEVAGRQ